MGRENYIRKNFNSLSRLFAAWKYLRGKTEVPRHGSTFVGIYISKPIKVDAKSRIYIVLDFPDFSISFGKW